MDSLKRLLDWEDDLVNDCMNPRTSDSEYHQKIEELTEARESIKRYITTLFEKENEL